MWIGASDVTSEGKWVWDNGAIPISPGYNNWNAGEPNNYNDEDCMFYDFLEGFGWNDMNCQLDVGFVGVMGGICELQP